MRPIELNIKYNIEGGELIIYDTINGEANALNKKFTMSFIHYQLRLFGIRMAVRYVMDHYLSAIKRRLCNRRKK